MKTPTPKPIRPAKSLSNLRKLLNAYHAFLSNFELAFACDDDCDTSNLDLDAAIAYPEQFDGDNAGTRDALLRSYGRLKQLLGERQIQASGLRRAAQTKPEPAPAGEIEDFDI